MTVFGAYYAVYRGLPILTIGLRAVITLEIGPSGTDKFQIEWQYSGPFVGISRYYTENDRGKL